MPECRLVPSRFLLSCIFFSVLCVFYRYREFVYKQNSFDRWEGYSYVEKRLFVSESFHVFYVSWERDFQTVKYRMDR